MACGQSQTSSARGRAQAGITTSMQWARTLKQRLYDRELCYMEWDNQIAAVRHSIFCHFWHVNHAIHRYLQILDVDGRSHAQ